MSKRLKAGIKIELKKSRSVKCSLKAHEVKNIGKWTVKQTLTRFRSFIEEYNDVWCNVTLDQNTIELGVLLVSNEEIHALNRDYRGKDRPTDVLSFSQLEGEYCQFVPELGLVLGDVVISCEMAELQAKERHHSFEEEMARLLIHGILHLLGFDHEKVSTTHAQRMRRVERALWQPFRI